nr:hypothetical protein OHB51_17255 [Micromonospora sp. NBC_00855]
MNRTTCSVSRLHRKQAAAGSGSAVVVALTALYVCILGVSTALPAAVACPVAEQVGWRFSLGIWAAPSVVALVPWLVISTRERRRRPSDADALESPPTTLVTRL